MIRAGFVCLPGKLPQSIRYTGQPVLRLARKLAWELVEKCKRKDKMQEKKLFVSVLVTMERLKVALGPGEVQLDCMTYRVEFFQKKKKTTGA